MRRPITALAAGYAGGIVFAEFMMGKSGAVRAALVGAAVILLALLAACIRKAGRERVIAVVLAAAFLAGSAALVITEITEDTGVPAAVCAAAKIPVSGAVRESGIREVSGAGRESGIREVSGAVIGVREKERGEKYVLTVRTSPGRRTLITVYGDVGEWRELAGRNVAVRGEVSAASPRRNPGCFSYELYLKSVRVRNVMSVKAAQLHVSDEPSGAAGKYLNAVSRWKGRFSSRLESAIGEEKAAVLTGMFFGEKDALDDDMYEEFQRNGTAHILAVSGLHVGVVYMCVSRIIRNRKSKAAAIVSLVLLFTYAALSSFSPSVMRAVMMITLKIASRFLRRRYDTLAAACACGLVSLILNPFAIFGTGFQLSYMAILSITAVSGALRNKAGGTAAALLSVQLGIAPLTAFIFNYFSLGAFIANIPIIFLAGLIIPGGIVLMPLTALETGLFDICANCVSYVADLMTAINGLTYMGGRLTFDVVSPPLFLLLCYYAFLFGGLSETMHIWIRRRMKKTVIAASCLALSFCLLFAIAAADNFGRPDAVFVDVGQGDCLHVRTDQGNFLVDGGGSASYDTGKNTLRPYLLKNGVRRVNIAFVSHLHTDHWQGIVSLAQAGMIDYICVAEANAGLTGEIARLTGMPEDRVILAARGDTVHIGSNAYVEVLGPPRGAALDTDDENSNSLILKVRIDGVTILMNGDIDAEGEKALIESGADVSCTVLKAAHHGSKYSNSEEFTEAADPQIAVIQVGKNNYGHPAPEVVERFTSKGLSVFRNDTQGAIGLEIKNGKARIKTMIRTAELRRLS